MTRFNVFMMRAKWEGVVGIMKLFRVRNVNLIKMTFTHIIGKIQRSFVEIHDRTTSQEADFATICQHFQGQTESWDNSSIKSRLESSDKRINIHISVLK